MLTGYLSLERRPGGDWANMWHWTERYIILLKQEAAPENLLPQIVLIAFLDEAFIRNIIIIKWIKLYNHNMHLL